MSGARDHLDHLDEQGVRPASARPAEHEAPRAISGSGDPRLGHAGAAATGLMHLQRMAGNAAVSSLVAPTVQRRVEIDEMSSDIGSGPAAASGPAGTRRRPEAR